MNNTQQHTNSNLTLPNNGSLKQSLYIAALDRFYGVSGLVQPVSDTVDGMCYNFDFYHPASDTLIKFFPKYDEDEFLKYSTYAETHEVHIILDAEEIAFKVCDGCGHKCVGAIPEELTVEAMLCDASLYIDDHIWELDDDEEDENGLSTWKPLLPLLLDDTI